MNVKEKYNYLASEDYDKKYKIKDEKILCMSEKKLEEIHPNGDCVVCGETIRNNKKRKFASITLAGEELYVSKYGGHSRIIFKTAGYVKTTKGNYIALLEYRMALFILLALLLITGTVFAVHSAMNKDVKAPDVAKAQNKKNVVYIYLPSGKVQYRMKSDVSGFEGYRLKLFIKDKDGRHKVHRQKVELDENGNIADSQINFRTLHYELKEGKYKGRIRLRQGENRERLKATVYVVSAKSGSSEVSYKKYIRVNRSKGLVKFLYKQGKNTSHSAIIQLILKNEDREILLAQSGILYPGNKITRLNLNDGVASDLSAGNYKGVIRVYINNGDETNKKIRADIDQIVIVK